jgi:hypothetical protein
MEHCLKADSASASDANDIEESKQQSQPASITENPAETINPLFKQIIDSYRCFFDVD